MSLDSWWLEPGRRVSEEFQHAAMERQRQLTKPPGALGELERLAIRLAGLQRSARPAVERVRIVVFAGDHGIAAAGVSAFPQAVTVEMLKNFAAGGAAINVLARSLEAELEVIDVGTVSDPHPLPGVLDQRVAAGTANFAEAPAMAKSECLLALNIGRASAERAAESNTQLFIAGEMGIGNTSAAAAVAARLLGRPAADLVGPGTGVDVGTLKHKTDLIAGALARHANADANDVLAVLSCFGGYEIVAMTGAYLRCAQLGISVLVDGFIASVSALAAVRLRSDVTPWLFFGHRSAEPGHGLVLEALDARPMLNLGMRLGEGSGAAMAVPLLRLACTLHGEMATFAEAQVSTG